MEEKKIDGWNEWAHRVLGDIEKLEDNQDQLFQGHNENKVEIAIIKTKVAFIAVVAGLVGGGIMSLVISLILHAVKG